MNANPFTDALGVEIKVGDTVVWPSRASSAVWLNYGVVTDLQMLPSRRHYDRHPVATLIITRSGGKSTSTQVLDNVAVVWREE